MAKETEIKSEIKPEVKTCSKCNTKIVSGYGMDHDKNILCYRCINEIEKDEIKNTPIGSKHLFYYTEEHINNDKYRFRTFVGNWPSTFKFSCYTREGKHNFGLKMISIWFKDHTGNNWYGRCINPDCNQAFMAKRIKGDI